MKLKVIVITALSIIQVSCGTGRKSYEAEYGMAMGGIVKTVVKPNGDYSSSDSFKKDYYNTEDKKIIFNANLRLSSSNPDSTIRWIIDLAKSNGGYVQSSNNFSVTIRVKSGDLESIVNTIEKAWEVSYKNIRGEDVTEEYENNNIKLDNLMKARERYLKLLEQAENVTEALSVEKELERLSCEIDLITGKMNRMKHLVSYATISVSVQKKIEIDQPTPGPLGWVFVGLYHGIKWLFVWE